MPNATLTIYLTDEKYKVYIFNKEEINRKTREFFKKMVVKNE